MQVQRDGSKGFELGDHALASGYGYLDDGPHDQDVAGAQAQSECVEQPRHSYQESAVVDLGGRCVELDAVDQQPANRVVGGRPADWTNCECSVKDIRGHDLVRVGVDVRQVTEFERGRPAADCGGCIRGIGVGWDGGGEFDRDLRVGMRCFKPADLAPAVRPVLGGGGQMADHRITTAPFCLTHPELPADVGRAVAEQHLAAAKLPSKCGSKPAVHGSHASEGALGLARQTRAWPPTRPRRCFDAVERGTQC
jgi:hypothetical protein